MSKELYFQEDTVDKTQRVHYGSSEVMKAFTDNVGEFYRKCIQEYGRCTGKIYVGEDNPKAIGWTFVKRRQYDDSNETFLQETWITLHEKEPTMTTTYHYAALK